MAAFLRLSDSLVVRSLTPADAAELYRLVDSNRDHLARWMPWAEAQTAAGTIEFIRSAQAQEKADGTFQAAIVSEGRIAGVVGFHALDRANRRVSIGYWLGERDQGRGLVTVAVSALIDHAFGAWDLHRVEIRVAVGNDRSAAVCDRLGFAREGVLRDAERFSDRYHDLVVHSLLEPEWRRR